MYVGFYKTKIEQIEHKIHNISGVRLQSITWLSNWTEWRSFADEEADEDERRCEAERGARRRRSKKWEVLEEDVVQTSTAKPNTQRIFKKISLVYCINGIKSL